MGRKLFHNKIGQAVGQVPERLCNLGGTETQMDAALRSLL